ncbi:MAG: IS66 family insertion sequence element accessory protein TnpB [Bacteroidales bacterium]|nr:IS66 family insertion sequence element accessory protein TnpB [Bacteroidales bacterium]
MAPAGTFSTGNRQILRSFDGLWGLVTDQLGQNPMSGDLFIFINKPRNSMKLFKWEPGGFVLFISVLKRVHLNYQIISVGLFRSKSAMDNDHNGYWYFDEICKKRHCFFYKMMLINIAESVI